MPAWWTCFLVSGIASQMTTGMINRAVARQDRDEWTMVLLVLAGIEALRLAAAALAMLIVYRIEQRQTLAYQRVSEQRAERLEG